MAKREAISVSVSDFFAAGVALPAAVGVAFFAAAAGAGLPADSSAVAQGDKNEAISACGSATGGASYLAWALLRGTCPVIWPPSTQGRFLMITSTLTAAASSPPSSEAILR